MGSLSRSGAFAAALTGGLVLGLGGLPWAVVLLAFFVSSSALSRLFARRKPALSEKFAKGNRRDLKGRMDPGQWLLLQKFSKPQRFRVYYANNLCWNLAHTGAKWNATIITVTAK